MDWLYWYLDYHLLFYAYAWNFVSASPERAILLILSCIITVWFIITVLHMRKEAKRLRLRGSKMSRNARKKWLLKHAADSIYAKFESELDQGIISHSEFTALIRIAKSRQGLPDLANRKKWGDVEIITPSKNTVTWKHLNAVKEGLLMRQAWRIKNYFSQKKPAIPGPPPGADIKSKPLRKRGALLARRPRAA